MIFKTEDILKKCDRTKFFRGKSLYASKKVFDFEVEEREGKILLESNVKGKIKEAYHVQMELDLQNKEEKIARYQCECQDFQSSQEICKHCAALAFAYVNVQLEQELNGIKPMVKPGGSSSDFGKIRLSREYSTAKTSHLMQKVLNKYNQQEMGRWADTKHGRIELDFELTSNRAKHKLDIALKVGNQKKYVVKGMQEFIENVIEGKKYSYGKFLTFYHNKNAFAKEAQELLQLVIECGKNQGMADSYAYLTQARENVRNLQLLPLYAQKLCEMNIGKYIVMDRQRYLILKRDPKLTLSIIQNQGGVTIQIEEFSYYNGADRDIVESNYILYIVSEEYQNIVMPFLKLVQSEFHSGFGRYITAKNGMFLSEEDYSAFYTSFYAPLKKYFHIQEIGGTTFSSFKVEECKLRFYLEQDDGGTITCRGECLYGVMRYDICDVYEETRLYRDMWKEMEAVHELEQYFSVLINEKGSYEYVIETQEQLFLLLQEGLEKLERLGAVFVPDEISKIKIQDVSDVSAGVRISGDLLELDVQLEGMDENQILEILSAYQQKKKFVRLKSGDFMRFGDKIKILDEMRSGLGISLGALAKGKIQLPKYRIFFLNDLMEKEEYREHLHYSQEFRQMLKNLEETEEKNFVVPKGIRAKLRNYQKKGYEWVCRLSEYGFGGILADDMGLGKTLQMICWLCRQKKKSLIVCPASLVYNWENEIQRFAPDMHCLVILGNQEERRELLKRIGEETIAVTSYDLLKRDMEVYEQLFFENMIIDEAQFIKNNNTLVSKAVKAVRASHRFALTGTPIENRLSDLWSIFDFVMPGFLYSYPRFKVEIEQPIVHNKDESALERLKGLISPFILRRRKRDVLDDLPEKLEEVVYTNMTDEQKELYYARYLRLKQEIDNKTESQFKQDKFQILSELTRLRQICCEPALCYEDYRGGSGKVELFLNRVEGAVEGGSKILVFSQFATMLRMLQGQLEKRGISTLLLTGKNTKEERKEMVDSFQGGEANVFLISLKAGGTGLNLTAADVVIHFDPWWNVAVQNQATDRAHRIGQRHVVTVIQLVTKHTIEERIIELQERKKQLVEDVISGENISNSSISKEEIMNLLTEF